MIVGMGIDLVDLTRIREILDRHSDRFTDRICRPGEVKACHGAARVQHVGGLFAAKEAVMKALGTGWDAGVSFRQIEIRRDSNGAPSVVLHDRAAEIAAELGVARIHLSITHEREQAAAVAVFETSRPPSLR
ncbi:MAG: holo-ACP synthase [Thermoanaerobaculia bacterium]|nr:holo-ACP synthase [Thermoanaerobaculia bacterium]